MHLCEGSQLAKTRAVCQKHDILVPPVTELFIVVITGIRFVFTSGPAGRAHACMLHIVLLQVLFLSFYSTLSHRAV